MSARFAQIGLVLLMLSLNCAVFLLMDVVLGRVEAFVITAVTTAIYAGLWFLLPWVARRVTVLPVTASSRLRVAEVEGPATAVPGPIGGPSKSRAPSTARQR